MNTTTHLKRTVLALVSITTMAIVALVASQNPSRSSSEPGEKPAQATPVRNAYFGDLHVHTGWSNDSFNCNVRTTPDDAYLFAKGEEIRHSEGFKIKIRKPLDFMGVTEHAEYLGIMQRLLDPKSPLYNHSIAKGLRSSDADERTKATIAVMNSVMTGKPIAEFLDKKVCVEIWQDIIKTANKHYQPGKFTTFIGAEWSSNGPKGYQNLHRNLIFRGETAPELPFTTFDSIKPEDLWVYLDKVKKEGFEVLAIPHNPNYSDGIMFRLKYSDGRPIDREYAERRSRSEALVEVTQIKGTSETHPLLSPDDEFAGFELNEYTMEMTADFGKSRPMPKGCYVRDAYRMGLVMEEQLGVNPYKFGVIGSSDTHNSGGPYDEATYFGKLGNEDGTPEIRLLDKKMRSAVVKTWSASGLCGVWADENRREAIFDGLKRKETFGTSGPRMQARLFGGWGYKAGEDKGQDYAKIGYDKGVPMGGDLPAKPEVSRAPTFLVWAAKDPDGANLDRIQIIKGWAKHGQSFEKIFNVAWSGGRSLDRNTGRLPLVGNTVDVAQATYSNTIGSDKLSAVWQDPEFDPTLRAFYYVRVLEIPTPRWSTFDAKKLGMTPIDPTTIQERAFTSPIWYTPAEGELAKGREKALTVAGLEKEKAKALSTEEIKALLVGKEARIMNLATGVLYDASWNEDGTRTLSALAGGAFGSLHGQGAAKSPYEIKDGKLSSRLDDGSHFSSRLFKQGSRYLAARDDEAGYVNYEVFPR